MAKSAREQQQEEHDALLEENDRRRLEHRPAEVHAEVPATSASGEDAKVVEVHAFGGHVYLNSHGEARFDRDAFFAFTQQCEAAFQAVT